MIFSRGSDPDPRSILTRIRNPAVNRAALVVKSVTGFLPHIDEGSPARISGRPCEKPDISPQFSLIFLQKTAEQIIDKIMINVYCYPHLNIQFSYLITATPYVYNKYIVCRISGHTLIFIYGRIPDIKKSRHNFKSHPALIFRN